MKKEPTLTGDPRIQGAVEELRPWKARSRPAVTSTRTLVPTSSTPRRPALALSPRGRQPSQAYLTEPQPANRLWSGASIAGVSAGFISAI